MNNLSLIIGIVLIVISIIFIFIGGWEKFHLQRENNAWLALFIVGWIIFVAGAALILLAILSNKKSKVPIGNVKVVTPSGVIPLPAVVPQPPALPSGPSIASLISGPPVVTPGIPAVTPGIPAVTPGIPAVTPGIPAVTSGPPAVTSSLGVSSMSNRVSGFISGPPSIYNLPPIPQSSKSELAGGVVQYQPLQPTNYPASLKGGLFD
jgi:hypothetical protein